MVASIQAALEEERYSEAVNILLPQFDKMFDAIHSLGYSKLAKGYYDEIFKLARKAKRKVAIPAGTYGFKGKGFNYNVVIKWDKLRFQMVTHGSGRPPKTRKVFDASIPKNASKALIELVWERFQHLNKRLF